jgi:hypothetical protein
MTVLSILSLILTALLAFPAAAQALLTKWELQFNETYYFNTGFEQHPPPLGNVNVTVGQGPTDVKGVFSFFIESNLGNATSLSNIVSVNPGAPNFLCVLRCFVGLDAAGLFLGDNPRIVGLAGGVVCCILEEIAFDGWFTKGGYNWDDPSLPAIPAYLKDIGPGEFVHRSADLGFRGLEFGTYTLRQVPEPSTALLFGLGLLALALRLSWVRRWR